MHGNRDIVSDRAIGSVLVVMSSAIFQLFAETCKAHKPVTVLACHPSPITESLDRDNLGFEMLMPIGIAGGLPGGSGQPGWGFHSSFLRNQRRGLGM